LAIQLSAFRLDDTIVLHPVKVLDVIEEISEVGSDPIEQVDRAYWESKCHTQSIAIVDKIVGSLRGEGVDPKLTYNRWHIAMGTTAYNFCWFHPRKSAGLCHIEVRVGETRDSVLTSLQEKGIDASPRRTENLTLSVTAKGLDEQSQLITDVLKSAEEASRT